MIFLYEEDVCLRRIRLLGDCLVSDTALRGVYILTLFPWIMSSPALKHDTL